MANPKPSNSIKKGEVRNPTGRPKKGETLTDILRLKTEDYTLSGKKPVKETIAEKLLELAMSGDMAAIKYVYDRMDGTPTQSVNLDANVNQKRIDLSNMQPEQLDVLLEAVTSVIEVPPSDSTEESEE